MGIKSASQLPEGDRVVRIVKLNKFTGCTVRAYWAWVHPGSGKPHGTECGGFIEFDSLPKAVRYAGQYGYRVVK